jgi:CheY-like chemotaxis protein
MPDFYETNNPMKQIRHNSIFIVDDDPDDRQVLLDAFLEHTPDIDCLLIENGEKLISNLHAKEGHYPELILLDLNMHGLSGLQTLEEIRKHKIFVQIPIVILTTSAQGTDREVAYKLGANCFLNKPQTYGKLIELTDAIVKLFLVRE